MSENKIDLDLNNYNLEDILHLFKIPTNFTEEDIKRSKKMVLMTHPDKSGLPADYFRFYIKAFKMLISLWEFKKKGDTTSDLASKNTDYEILTDEHKTTILDGFFDKNDKIKKKNTDFNKWFNGQFEKSKQHNDNIDTGYGDWLKSDQDIETESVSTMAGMKEVFDKKKSQARAMVLHNDIQDFNTHTSVTSSELSTDSPQSFDSDLYSSLPYQDLQKAHCESVIPVTEEDFNNTQKFRNMNEIMSYRNNQDTKPLSEQQAMDYLSNREKSEEDKGTKRAYQLAKEMEESTKREEDFWRQMRLLENKP
tara:strand:- start:3063 stop:3986 length:924 start_codon:yes stop_codon:yes gene_type:complete